MWPFIVVAFVTLVVVGMIWNWSKQRFARPDRAPRVAESPEVDDVRVQPAADGFWLQAPRLSPGSVIHYRYWSKETMRTGSVAVSHGPQGAFVYTGAVPSRIEVLYVLPPSQGPMGNDYGFYADDSVPSPGMSLPDAPEAPEPEVSAPEPITGPPPAY